MIAGGELITCDVIEPVCAIDVQQPLSVSNDEGRPALQQRCIAAGFNAEMRYQAMQRFTLQTIESAPEESRSTLQALQQSLGFLPNVIATMANSPVLLNGFAGSFGSFHGGSLNEIERQVVLLTNAVAIKCPLTVAIHSTFAIEDGIAESEVKAVRDGKLPRDPKYAALSALAKTLIETRGNVTEADVEKFTSAGYSRVQILEVITAVGVSTLAATTANMAGTPVDKRFKAQTWSAA
jgi:alkylhydroperoxidase family enzyme